MTTIAPHESFATTVEREVQQAVSDVLAQTMAARAQQRHPFAALTPLRWTPITNNLGRADVVVGKADETTDPRAVSAALATWADTLDLVESDSGQPGTKHYVGCVDDQMVRVWGIVDRQRFDDHNATTERAFTSIVRDLTDTDNTDH